ncbi:hypothetical protein VOLCADRAFT_104238 [Volvox carteri f. nagariensis]|uniref:Uncharacterized protein n=1 Tax=Volvox carteri f. nagariensis TaxID=3068 RepID=D8TSA5_VOLCA|nr:uncharacterized protein VOLCADRAFT_104238 [Volvox carteri f. nagariensis]EFJ49658.1 hypothetical protein VOLCADRAFT_104238 [Volvox carteri f. nagariensis]|eukprot:XP_002949165.1 hypothetical protein VOLCADRAFT_104238 [Volvox carteri f. nagariensis]
MAAAAVDKEFLTSLRTSELPRRQEFVNEPITGAARTPCCPRLPDREQVPWFLRQKDLSQRQHQSRVQHMRRCLPLARVTFPTMQVQLKGQPIRLRCYAGLVRSAQLRRRSCVGPASSEPRPPRHVVLQLRVCLQRGGHGGDGSVAAHGDRRPAPSELRLTLEQHG